MCAESVPFWVELKITNSNRVNVSSHQVAWNYAHCKSGGVSFYLVSPLSSSNLYLFDGIHGRELVVHGLSRVGSGRGRDQRSGGRRGLPVAGAGGLELEKKKTPARARE